MHCTSCAMNIDGELEDTPGVIEAKTSYQKQQTVVTYDEGAVSEAGIADVIKGLGYTGTSAA